MKVIDLLVKIANGGLEKNRVKCNNSKNEWYDEDFLFSVYRNFGGKSNDKIVEFLNDEVEIIEEDKEIEKIEIVNNGNMNAYAIYSADGVKCALTKHSKVMCDKINELIDKVNSLKNKQ